MSNDNRISLTLPVDAAYVSTARLTASSIANRMRFGIDEIEDIKAAVSEAGTYIVKNYSSGQNSNLDIAFIINDKSLAIEIRIDKPSKISLNNDDMSLIMIKALMTEFEISFLDEKYLIIKMLKERSVSQF